ncbi:MAG TPA: hypothetical protein VF765_12210 [Polyangiaceae bacterium]
MRGVWRCGVLALVAACGSSGASTQDAGGPDGFSGDSSSAPPEGGTGDAGSGADGGDAAASCVPAIPKLTWKSPYAGWTRGVPTDPAFFPIGVWLQLPSHASELSKIGVNVYVGNNAGTDPLMAGDLASLKALGMYAIIGQDSVGLANIDDPTIIGWWMTPDEPDNAQSNGMGGYGPPVAPATLVTQYQSYVKADPTRPVWLGLGQGVAYDNWEGRGSNAPPESQYVPASDIVSFDIYPYNNCGGDTNEQATCGQFWLNAFGIDRLHTWSNRGQAVWSDFETTVIAAGSTAGPTPVQTRSEVWLGLIHGANGILYFIDSWNPSFREDAIFETPAMVSTVTALDQEIAMLAPVLNSATIPNLVSASSSSATAPIDTMVKASGSKLYVMSAISRTGTATGTFTIAGMTGSAVATVVGENRTVNVTKGRFTDTFAQNDVHVYVVDLASATCK